MSTQDNTASVVVQGGVSSAALIFLKMSLANMIPFLIVAAVLIIADLYFGIRAAKKRGEAVRASTAIRKTFGKMFEYICWVTLAASLSLAFEMQAIEWVVLGIVMGNELISVAGNYFYIHGYKITGFDFLKIIKGKTGIDTDDIKIEKIDDK